MAERKTGRGDVGLMFEIVGFATFIAAIVIAVVAWGELSGAIDPESDVDQAQRLIAEAGIVLVGIAGLVLAGVGRIVQLLGEGPDR